MRNLLSLVVTPRAIRFVCIGLIGMACDLTTFTLLYTVAHAPIFLCTATAWCVASIALFVVARLWVFPDAQTTVPVSSGRYVVLIAGNGIATVSIASFLVGGLGIPYVLVRIGMSACIIPINYLISKHWVFDAND